MFRLVVISVCLQFGWTSGSPAGAFAYQDSMGNRYGGTYGLGDEQTSNRGPFNFNPAAFFPHFNNDVQDFFPEYFRNFENLLQEAFASNNEYQRKALETAKKAFDITSNQAGFIPNYDFSRFSPFGGMPGFGQFGMPNMAFASGMAAPGFSHQIAAIDPMNPNMPNVDVTNRFGDTSSRDGNGYMSVSSSSHSSSMNVNGQEFSDRHAETVVDNNGVVTRYKVQS